MTKDKEPYLIKLDIDGTSTNPDFSTLNKNLKKVLQKLKSLGHKICFTTGRNYLSALPFYNEVGLDTFLVTYNGGFINNPSSKNNKEVVVFHTINNEITKEILNEKIIRENIENILIDYVSSWKKNGEINLKTVSSSDDIYYREIFFNNNRYKKEENHEKNEEELPIYISKNYLEVLGEKDVLQLVLEFKFTNNEKLFNEILVVLLEKYGEA